MFQQYRYTLIKRFQVLKYAEFYQKSFYKLNVQLTLYRTNHKYKMANNEMISKINRSNYNVHAVNLLQLNLPLDLTQYCQSIATVLFIYIHIIHMYVCMQLYQQ